MNNSSPFLRRWLSLLLLALIVALDGAAQRFEPRILFESNRNGNWDIDAIDVNGNNLLQLTDNPTDDRSPACSPDGRMIAFTSMRHGPPDIYLMDSNGNNVVRLTNSNWREGSPFWSPDGTKIAFTSYRVDNSEIYTMNPDGNNLFRLTRHQMWESSPSCSPDGSKIAFDSNPDGPFGSDHIFVMDADGTRVRNLTRNKDISNSRHPAWSPDGSWIAFDAWRDSNDIYVMTANGKRLRKLTEGKGNNRSPSYSSNGTRIIFVSDRDGNHDIHIMDTNGRGVVKLTKTQPGVENRSPHWLPEFLAVSPHERTPTFWGAIKSKQ